MDIYARRDSSKLSTTLVNNVITAKMSSAHGLTLSVADQKHMNKGRKRKITPVKWKRNVRKAARDAGEPYISSRKQPVAGKLTPDEVSATTL